VNFVVLGTRGVGHGTGDGKAHGRCRHRDDQVQDGREEGRRGVRRLLPPHLQTATNPTKRRILQNSLVSGDSWQITLDWDAACHLIFHLHFPRCLRIRLQLKTTIQIVPLDREQTRDPSLHPFAACLNHCFICHGVLRLRGGESMPHLANQSA
jgi:hypothetical protein